VDTFFWSNKANIQVPDFVKYDICDPILEEGSEASGLGANSERTDDETFYRRHKAPEEDEIQRFYGNNLGEMSLMPVEGSDMMKFRLG
jgi:hypothetical protein